MTLLKQSSASKYSTSASRKLPRLMARGLISKLTVAFTDGSTLTVREPVACRTATPTNLRARASAIRMALSVGVCGFLASAWYLWELTRAASSYACSRTISAVTTAALSATSFFTGTSTKTTPTCSAAPVTAPRPSSTPTCTAPATRSSDASSSKPESRTSAAVSEAFVPPENVHVLLLKLGTQVCPRCEQALPKQLRADTQLAWMDVVCTGCHYTTRSIPFYNLRPGL